LIPNVKDGSSTDNTFIAEINLLLSSTLAGCIDDLRAGLGIFNLSNKLGIVPK
jgi:hypothetical protein